MANAYAPFTGKYDTETQKIVDELFSPLSPFTSLEEIVTATPTATKTSPNKGDEVKVEITGKFGVNSYGERHVVHPDGTKTWLTGNHEVTVTKPVDDKHPIGTFAVDYYGDRYVKVDKNDWRFLSPFSVARGVASTAVTTWAGLETREAVILEKPAKPKGKKLDPMTWRTYKRTPADCTVKVNGDGRSGAVNMMHVTYGKETPSVTLGKDEAVRLANDILATFSA